MTADVATVSVISKLARPNGTFAMLANDHRETLRNLLAEAGKSATDDDVRWLKREIARYLSPAASAMLIDREYGLDAVREPGAVAATCGVIVAVDRLVQPLGAPVQSTTLDEEAMRPDAVQARTAALKFLTIWRPEDARTSQDAMLAKFVEGCHELGVAAVAEAIVRVPENDTDALDRAILQAASEVGRHGPDVYKAQVPTLGMGTAGEIEFKSRALTAAVRCPWVVLSTGVPSNRFALAVEAACRGGASGFLAGRGIWGASIRASDTVQDLKTEAVRRFAELTSIVDACGRPWFEPMNT